MVTTDRLSIAARAAELGVALRMSAADLVPIAFALADLAIASTTPIFFVSRIGKA